MTTSQAPTVERPRKLSYSVSLPDGSRVLAQREVALARAATQGTRRAARVGSGVTAYSRLVGILNEDTATASDCPQDAPFTTTTRREGYCVRTATLVLPRTGPLMVDPSWKLITIRLFAGSKGIVPEPFTVTRNASCSPAAIVIVALGPAVSGLIQAAVLGFV